MKLNEVEIADQGEARKGMKSAQETRINSNPVLSQDSGRRAEEAIPS